MNASERQTILPRIVRIGEALDDGEVGLARSIVADLETELAPVQPSASCPECGLAMWPGELAKHLSVVHLAEAA